MTNKNRMFFVNLANMEKYCGYEEGAFGGGSYVEENGYGHELLNFKRDGDKYYGYTTPDCTVNLESIDKKSINEDTLGKYLDNVLVVFTCKRKKFGRVIVGFYKNARVYSEAVDDERESRFFKEKYIYIKYNLICDATNVVLIPPEERNFCIPRSKYKNSGGYGQYNVWYANGTNDIQIKQKVLEYIYDKIEGLLLDNDDINEQKKIQESELASQKEIENSANEKLDIIEGKQGEVINKKHKYAKTALQDAQYICQIEPTHKTFKTKKRISYMEGHHLIPCTVANSKKFEKKYKKNIDCVANIVCLCPNCHRAVHFGDWNTKKEKIKLMFAKQKDRLKTVGIIITEEELFKLYKTSNQ